MRPQAIAFLSKSIVSYLIRNKNTVKLEYEQSGQRLRLKENTLLQREVKDNAMASRSRKASRLSAYDFVCLSHAGSWREEADIFVGVQLCMCESANYG
jgi:hypothetical protein